MAKNVIACLFLVVLSVGAIAQTHENFETSVVHPIRVSADGLRLLVTNAPAGTLEVYSLQNGAAPVLLEAIPVGLEPAGVTPRTADEVWVVNNLSDSISIVSLSAGRVVQTLRVKDEPSDVVFAGGKAFVSATASDSIHVFNATTRAFLGEIAMSGKDPRALAVNAAGTRVYVAIHKSGNRTVVVPLEHAPAPPPPTNSSLPPAPQQSLIVSLDDPVWQSQFPFDLPDHDIIEIDVANESILRAFTGVGTILSDLTVDGNGDLIVTNIESRNIVRFEPNLKGHAIDSRVTLITTGVTPVVTPVDLNPGINYATLPNASAIATALAEPQAVVNDGTETFVAAQGTDRVGVLDSAGNVLDRIEIGVTPGTTVNSRAKRGPRGLALHPSGPWLYVFNRFSHSVTVVDRAARSVVLEFDLRDDPETQMHREGRNFLYDAKLSGNGTMSCASCHIDGDLDMMAWDLGNPGGSLEPIPQPPFPLNIGMDPDFHPMKGPMITQTLRGLDGLQPFHWRGDRAGISDFNPAFDSLLGGAPLTPADLSDLVHFMTNMKFPGNPNQHLDRTLDSFPPNSNAVDGKIAFEAQVVTGLFGINLSCAVCHSLPNGSNNQIISEVLLQAPQSMKVPQLRNIYRRTGAEATGDAKSAVGFIHDGTEESVASFLALPVFNPWPADKMDDIVKFLDAFDTGTAPIVGYQVSIDATSAASGTVIADMDLLEARADAGDCDIIAKGTYFGIARGFVYDSGISMWISDDPTLGGHTGASLRADAAAGNAQLTFTGVALGEGDRRGIDADGDGTSDALDGLAPYGVPVTGSAGPLRLGGNREPIVGSTAFAFVCHNVSPFGLGALALSYASAATPILGVTAYVDSSQFFAVLSMPADGGGTGVYGATIPNIPGLAGFSLFAQAAFADGGAPQGLAVSNGLKFTIRP